MAAQPVAAIIKMYTTHLVSAWLRNQIYSAQKITSRSFTLVAAPLITLALYGVLHSAASMAATVTRLVPSP